MGLITEIWNATLVYPIETALLWLAVATSSAGLAIILFTVIVRTVLLPLGLKQVHSQKALMQLQPQLKDIQRRYAGDRAKLGQEQMRLYKESGVNPLAGCLPLVVQMPVWFALYSALNQLSQAEDGPFQQPFLWIQSLAHPATPTADPNTWPLIILPVLTAATQWVVQKMSVMPTEDPQQAQMNRMMEFMPIMFLVFSFQVASGLVLYWVASNLYSIVQQRFTMGWGTLPYLGSNAVQSSVQTSTATSEEDSPPRRRRSSGSGRRKRGK